MKERKVNLEVGQTVRIVLSANPTDQLLGREYVDQNPEGEFLAAPDGAVIYRHPVVGEMFANDSPASFLECVRAWDRYVARVTPRKEEAEQLRGVEELRRDLEAQNGLRTDSFWSAILEQAEDGNL
jgi:hypothetical protein